MTSRATYLSRLRNFKDDAAGDVAIMFGLLAFVMFMFVGAAVDMGRWMHARKQMTDIVDASVLAGARELQTTGSETAAKTKAERFFAESAEGRLYGVTKNVNFETRDTGDGLTFGVTANSTATIKTPFMSLGGVPELPLLNTGGAEWSQAKLATEGNAQQNFEISMMLDVSGSMSGSKISDLRLAAEDLINIVVWQDQSEFTSRVALVPFSQDVRLPTSVYNAVTSPTERTAADKSLCPSNKSINTSGQCGTNNRDRVPFKRTPCVVERTGNDKYTDGAPGNGKYIAIQWRNNSTSCLTPSNAMMMPLTNDKSALVSRVQTMSLGSGTGGHVGTAWAYYALSPNFNSSWPNTSNHAAAYADVGTKKIAIIMTDGMYNSPNDSQGIEAGEYWVARNIKNSAANGTPQAQSLALCQAMKQNGITVYSVGFDLASISPLSDQTTSRNLLRDCATDPTKFFDAEDGAALRQAFRTIALEISSLYLDK